MLVAGLTGNYGMGKSSVLAAFSGLGAATLDSDRVVEALLKEPAVLRKVSRLLGPGVLHPSGTINKQEAARRVFAEPSLRIGLEKILHPLVFRRVQSFIRTVKGRDRVVVVEVPLLFEGGYTDRFQRIITVYTTRGAALERLRMSGVARRDALARMKTQLPISMKKKRSDYLINNSGDRRETLMQVKEVYGLLAAEASAEKVIKNKA
ncbi:MAG: dephospho-CoA kinase [Nitrospiraceae bacterium]|nr:dephospho-CoA kinase [Nitrospiraceae bacterium]